MSPRPRRAGRQAPRGRAASEELSQLLFKLLMRHKVRFVEESAELGVSPIQARALLCLEPDRPLTMSEVAQELGCGPSNITAVIDKLEARALVTRRLRAGDRRIKTVAVTRKGAALRKSLSDRMARPAPWMLALGDEEQRQLVEILRRALEP
jgi:DNA-binding MarR family transcriptional regulator